MPKAKVGMRQRNLRIKFLWVIPIVILVAALLSACKEEAPTPPPPTATEPLPTKTSGPTPTPRELLAPTVTQTNAPTETIEPGNDAVVPDFSQVRLHAVTFLEDPLFFQVSLDGWPIDAGDDVAVRVGEEIYTCERLFPDQYPFRVYCWGASPPEGAHVVLDIFVERVADPIMEVPFQVPYLPEPTPTK